jgi:hypothetical protein
MRGPGVAGAVLGSSTAAIDAPLLLLLLVRMGMGGGVREIRQRKVALLTLLFQTASRMGRGVMVKGI